MKDKSLRVLMIEDSKDDELLIIRELNKSGYDPVYERIETASAMKKALQDKQWDIILCDYKMPQFDAPAAIALLKEANIDIPLIIVSGTIGEDVAVECMRLGAQDYIMKDKLSRLCPAIAREREEAKVRKNQKQAEEKLRHEEHRFRTLAEQSSDIIVIVNREGIITYENQAIERALGFKVEERIGASLFDLIHPDDLKLLTDASEKLASDKNAPTLKYEVRLRHKNGSWRTFEVTGSNLVSDTVIEGLIINLYDITERKQAEAKLKQTLESLKKAVGTTIQVLVSALESRDPYTTGHQSRVAHLACAIGTEMGLDQDKIDGIRMAGVVHDIGKLSIPVEILTKPGKLTDIEFLLIKQHSQTGYEMLKDVESPWPLAQIVYQHHERINGSGYPHNLKGDEIILEARIMAVADVVEAMASHRPYRASLGIGVALEEINKNKGILYDEVAADTCLKLFAEKGYKLP